MLMESYPGKQESLSEQVKVFAVGIKQQFCLPLRLNCAQELGDWINLTHYQHLSMFWWKKPLILSTVRRDAHEGSIIPLRKQKATKTALSGYKTFSSGLLPKVSLLKKSLFSISQSAVSFVSCPKTQSSPRTLSEPSFKSQLLTSICFWWLQQGYY